MTPNAQRTMAIFSVDPGKTTGLAWGVFRDAGTTARSLQFGKLTGDCHVQGIDSLDSARLIVERFHEFCSTFNRSKWDGDVHLVIEDFVLRPQKATADREMLTPVEITGLINGILYGVHGALMPVATYQMPNEAKGFATTERLKRWGVKVQGRHATDAWRHIALYIAKQGVATTRKAGHGKV